LFRQQYTKWRPLQQWVETNGLGISLYQHLIAEGLPIGKLNAGKADKLTRFIPAATRITAGAVYFLAGAPWLNDYEAELLGFPNVKQDGQVDVTSYACQVVIEHPFVEMSYETSYIGTSYSSGSMRI
jgi:predicted phage terminase large subunit-like protein